MEQQTGKAPTSQQEQPKKETKKPIGKTYRPLKLGDRVDRCSYILANSCQCWKAGEEEVSDVRKDGEELVYQFCERHVRIQKAIDAGYLKPEHVTETTPDEPEFLQAQTPASQEVNPPPKVEEKKEPQASQKQEEHKDNVQGGKEEKKPEYFYKQEGTEKK